MPATSNPISSCVCACVCLCVVRFRGWQEKARLLLQQHLLHDLGDQDGSASSAALLTIYADLVRAAARLSAAPSAAQPVGGTASPGLSTATGPCRRHIALTVNYASTLVSKYKYNASCSQDGATSHQAGQGGAARPHSARRSGRAARVGSLAVPVDTRSARGALSSILQQLSVSGEVGAGGLSRAHWVVSTLYLLTGGSVAACVDLTRRLRAALASSQLLFGVDSSSSTHRHMMFCHSVEVLLELHYPAVRGILCCVTVQLL